MINARCISLGAVAVSAVLVIGGCAMVPKESVELSTTVGRDIASVHEAHRNLANALFGRMKQDVNRFVDDVYAPFQIQFVLASQKRLQEAGDRDNLFSVLDIATRSPNDAQG
jgi:hypothetical protein